MRLLRNLEVVLVERNTLGRRMPAKKLLRLALWSIAFDEFLKTLHEDAEVTPVAYVDNLTFFIARNEKEEVGVSTQRATEQIGSRFFQNHTFKCV